jgi:hypothetical protein
MSCAPARECPLLALLWGGREHFRGGNPKNGPIDYTARPVYGGEIYKINLASSISRAYRGIGLNRLDKVSKVHLSFIPNFGKGGSPYFPRNLGLVWGPMRRRRRVWIFGKVCECSLEAVRELYFRRGGRRSVECSEKNGHCEMVEVG